MNGSAMKSSSKFTQVLTLYYTIKSSTNRSAQHFHQWAFTS